MTESIHIQFVCELGQIHKQIFIVKQRFITPLYVNCCYTLQTRSELQMKLKYYILC